MTLLTVFFSSSESCLSPGHCDDHGGSPQLLSAARGQAAWLPTEAGCGAALSPSTICYGLSVLGAHGAMAQDRSFSLHPEMASVYFPQRSPPLTICGLVELGSYLAFYCYTKTPTKETWRGKGSFGSQVPIAFNLSGEVGTGLSRLRQEQKHRHHHFLFTMP